MDKARTSAMALLLATLPARADAQSAWWDWTLEPSVRVEAGYRSDGDRAGVRVTYVEPGRAAVPRRDDDRYRGDDRDRRDGRYEARVTVVRADAPAFCRSGAGHPVYGRRWCVEKGYGLGHPAAVAVRWERRSWNDVVFARVWYRTRAEYIDGRDLREVVGRGTWARLELARRDLGGRYELTGRWLRPRAGVLVLQVRSGPIAIAELTDLNGDGRVDVVMVAR